MKNVFIFAIFSIAFCTHAQSATTQIDVKNGIKIAINDDPRCKKNVAQYIETLQFVRQSAGDQLGAKVMSSYVPLDQLNQVVSSSGYCAGEQLLRDKKALR